ncbi:MAG TPA: hypothetical protein IGS51_04475, partial [Thermoleptolyngbya sp. M55_K2018_002]|nr:hypothetical protein [Thermoleptolyngbya sp. M55_K2018_002]
VSPSDANGSLRPALTWGRRLGTVVEEISPVASCPGGRGLVAAALGATGTVGEANISDGVAVGVVSAEPSAMGDSATRSAAGSGLAASGAEPLPQLAISSPMQPAIAQATRPGRNPC